MVHSRREHNLGKVLKITFDGAQAHGSNYKEYGQQHLREKPLPVFPGVMHTFQQHGHHPLHSQSNPTHGWGPSEAYIREKRRECATWDRGNHLNCFNSGKFRRWAFKVQSFQGVIWKVQVIELIFHKLLQETKLVLKAHLLAFSPRYALLRSSGMLSLDANMSFAITDSDTDQVSLSLGSMSSRVNCRNTWKNTMSIWVHMDRVGLCFPMVLYCSGS